MTADELFPLWLILPTYHDSVIRYSAGTHMFNWHSDFTCFALSTALQRSVCTHHNCVLIQPKWPLCPPIDALYASIACLSCELTLLTTGSEQTTPYPFPTSVPELQNILHSAEYELSLNSSAAPADARGNLSIQTPGYSDVLLSSVPSGMGLDSSSTGCAARDPGSYASIACMLLRRECVPGILPKLCAACTGGRVPPVDPPISAGT